VLALGYQSSRYLTERVPDLGIADLPFIFPDTATARAAMDGRLGHVLTERIEAGMDYRILGYFENGFRHVSNKLRPVRMPADMKGMSIRVLPSKVRAQTFARGIEDHGSPKHSGVGQVARRAGESIPQYRHVRRSQLPQIPHGDEPLLPLAPDLLSPPVVRRVAAGAAGGNARGVGRRGVSTQSSRERGRGLRCN
jgi:hypothetical protein